MRIFFPGAWSIVALTWQETETQWALFCSCLSLFRRLSPHLSSAFLPPGQPPLFPDILPLSLLFPDLTPEGPCFLHVVPVSGQGVHAEPSAALKRAGLDVTVLAGCTWANRASLNICLLHRSMVVLAYTQFMVDDYLQIFFCQLPPKTVFRTNCCCNVMWKTSTWFGFSDIQFMSPDSAATQIFVHWEADNHTEESSSLGSTDILLTSLLVELEPEATQVCKSFNNVIFHSPQFHLTVHWLWIELFYPHFSSFPLPFSGRTLLLLALVRQYQSHGCVVSWPSLPVWPTIKPVPQLGTVLAFWWLTC